MVHCCLPVDIAGVESTAELMDASETVEVAGRLLLLVVVESRSAHFGLVVGSWVPWTELGGWQRGLSCNISIMTGHQYALSYKP